VIKIPFATCIFFHDTLNVINRKCLAISKIRTCVLTNLDCFVTDLIRPDMRFGSVGVYSFRNDDSRVTIREKWARNEVRSSRKTRVFISICRTIYRREGEGNNFKFFLRCKNDKITRENHWLFSLLFSWNWTACTDFLARGREFNATLSSEP